MIKPTFVKPMPDYKLYLEFSNNEKWVFDVKPYLDMPFYSPLKDISQFQKVYVSEYTIEWANGRDISPHEIFDNSLPVQ